MVNDFDRMGVLVAFDGKMHWEPGGIFTTTCDIDITFFPFDLQRCEIIVGAWAYYRWVSVFGFLMLGGVLMLSQQLSSYHDGGMPICMLVI